MKKKRMELTPLRQKSNAAQLKRCNTLLAVLENPSNIENIGAVLRNIDALGISKLYIISDKFTHFPKPGRENAHSTALMRTSVSAVRWVYVHRFTTTAECFDYLEKKGYVSLLTSPHNTKSKQNMALLETDFTVFKKLAIWFGNEARGVSEEAVAKAHGCVQIDMCGIVESLNLSVCTGIVLHHIATQRRKFSPKKKQNIQTKRIKKTFYKS